ncbi:HEAT repeat-containing protein 6-like [Mya arenaria]|uniref:HEAT repeat-containing protein 6-like n=1 Tax=Mya arenaria TaxID=6604 RepID=UPI0022E50921|nr:HEAT repeat-containing protein 6-like [Mya arenaria]
MAVAANFDCPERDKFQHCFTKLRCFVYTEDNSVKTDLNLLLDQVNSLEYSTVLVTPQQGSEVLIRLCCQIPYHQERLVVKTCQAANLWMKKQRISLSDECVMQMCDYLVLVIQRCQTWAVPEILRTLASLFYENTDKLQQYHERLLGRHGILTQLINSDITDPETLKEAVVCLQCLTLRPSTSEYLSAVHMDVCYDVFCMLLHRMPSVNIDLLLQCKILTYCLRGIQNLIRVTKEVPAGRLGVLLAAVRAYMFYGVGGQAVEIPESLYPSPLTKIEPPRAGKPSTQQATAQTSGQKKSKRKPKKQDKKGAKQNKKQDDLDGDLDPNEPSAGGDTVSQGNDISLEFDFDPMASYVAWSKVSSSDSEWSDTEGGQGSRARSNSTKVRQCALSTFYWIAKFTEKKVLFGYWWSFLPDSQMATSSAGAQSLLNIVLKDTSPKCRMGALAAISVLIDNTKLMLSAAEDSDDTKTATFIPFSIVLGTTIREVHRCLFLALAAENFPITLTQLLKCFGTVIANVPYHRMRPGLLGKIVKHIRHFVNHRDPNVRVACLTCLGSIANIRPPLMEVCHIVQSVKPSFAGLPLAELDKSVNSSEAGEISDLASGFSNSLTVSSLENGGAKTNEYSGETTPKHDTAYSSGTATPAFSEQVLQMFSKDISWIVRLCVKNILPQGGQEALEEYHTEPLPVRLESLQVLSNLTKGYFPVIRNCVPLLQELTLQCFCDSDPVVKLHTAKLLDELSQVLQQAVSTVESGIPPTPDVITKDKVLDFWLALLNGPIQEVLQARGHDAVKAVACDCLANLGDLIFKSLPLDKRLLCVTVALGLAGDEDRLIRAAAIRTLGIFVLYKTLREDVSFVVDCAAAILGAIDDANMFVKVKAAWSLANLGDAIASNREDGDSEFMEDFSDVVLLNIITTATRLSQESDKIKPNAVRTLGNILRCLSNRQLGKEAFVQAVNSAVASLMKCASSGAMKVRWNACYAISNMYKNEDLNQGQTTWNRDVLDVLCSVITDCKNFKVRINAAIGLSAPELRAQYGNQACYCRVWEGVIVAFGTAENIAEFIDFKYRDNLVEQLCMTTFHLLSLVTVDDLGSLYPLIDQHREHLTACLNKYCTHIHKQPNIMSRLEGAATHLAALWPQLNSNEQSLCLRQLMDMCNEVTKDKESVPMSRQKLAFKQIYD